MPSQQRWAFLVWVLVLMLLFMCGLTLHERENLESASRYLRNREVDAVRSYPIPTPSPTRTPIHVSVVGKSSNIEGQEESISNDSDLTAFGSRKENDDSLTFTSSNRSSENEARRLGIIAVTLAAVFALLMLTATAIVWRKYLWAVIVCPAKTKHDNRAEDIGNDSDAPSGTIHSHAPYRASGGDSILRNPDSSVSYRWF